MDSLKRNPVVWVMSALAGAQALLLAAGFTDVVGAKWSAFGMAFVVALQLVVQVWVRGQVTPVGDPRGPDGAPLVRRNVGVLPPVEGE